MSGTTLQQQQVVVIGGTSGIGRAVAQEAAARGAIVTVIGRSAKASTDVRAAVADVTDSAALAQAFAAIGKIDHLVLTAGARVGSPTLAGLTRDELELAFNVKLFGSLFAIQAALPYLSPNASVTLTSGLLSRKFGPGSLLKSGLNAAVDATAKSLARELAPRRVNVVSPGVVDTELWGEAGAESRVAAMARIGQGLPVGRTGTPQDVAQAYMLVMENGFVSGAVIDVDGGGLLS
ncbi:dehydrogenase [Herbaspirillum hiltneri N3]|uniref:Dehydrogenase n=1 Tax=Herbaspirillum hiltneri N3 TaxID=1262470 RepID=A0ABN4HT50_9BURK|nr:SDR family oxidoreductase [Herbaspirillum hiltneri]AKZ62153.1 dehydrogenase [Herbaspirillum hiltneri N3]